MSGSTRTKRLLAALFGAALALAIAPPALSHAAYKSSDPANKSTVESPPSQITAEFTEPMTDSSYMEVFDPCGEQVDNGDSRVSTSSMAVTMSGDKAGTYTVEFAAQSVDSHITYGSFTFTSSGGAACPGDEPEPTKDPGGGAGGGSNPAPDPGSPGGSASGGGDPGGTTRPDTGGSGGAVGGDPKKGAGAGKTASGMPAGNGRPTKGGNVDVRLAAQQQQEGGQPEPAAWDLPIGGVLMALFLCVMIGAAGGRVYAGIVGPARR